MRGFVASYLKRKIVSRPFILWVMLTSMRINSIGFSILVMLPLHTLGTVVTPQV